MSTTEKDRTKTGGPNGTGNDESRDRILDRNIAALLSQTPDPPRMEPGARDRILASLNDRVQKQDAPAPAASPGLGPGGTEEVRPEAAGPLPAVEEKQDRSIRLPVGVVVAGIAAIATLAVGGGFLGYFLYEQSQQQKRMARIQEHKEKEWKQEFARLKKDQDHLRKVNRQKDDLLRRLQLASHEEKVAIQAKLARLRKRAQALADNVARRKRKRGRRAARRGSAPLPRRRPAAANSYEALHGL